MFSYFFRKLKILFNVYIKRTILDFKDLFNVLFLSSSQNYIRVKSLEKKPDGHIECTFTGNFKSYRALKKFQKRMRVAMSTGTVIFLVVMSSILTQLTAPNIQQSMAATFGWIQTDWSGEDTVETAQHTVERDLAEEAKWDKYASQINLDATSTAGQITLAANIDNWQFNTTNTLNTWATTSEVQVLGSSLSLLKEDGEVCANATVCGSDACSNDWSTDTNLCHSDNTKCVYDNGGTLEFYNNGYELCSGDDWYKSCTSGIWGAEQLSPNTTNNYCTAQGDSMGGFEAQAVCNSGADGGYVNPGCVACTDAFRATTTKDACFDDCGDDNTKCIQPIGDDYYCYSGNGTCHNGEISDNCDDASECDGSLICYGNTACKIADGDACSFDSECASAACSTTCKLSPGAACTTNDQCGSNLCETDVCIAVCGANSICGQDCSYMGDMYPTIEIAGECWFQKGLIANTGTYEPARGGGGKHYGPGQDLCPSGWHAATKPDFQTVLISLGMTQEEVDGTGWIGTNEGAKLAGHADLWYLSSVIENDPDFGLTGLNLVPGGYTYNGGCSWNYAEISTAAYYHAYPSGSFILDDDRTQVYFGTSASYQQMLCVKD